MRLHFIGVGGAGMAPLAELALARGHRVSGSDLVSNAKSERLRKLGAEIFIGHAPENLPDDTELAVCSSAVAPDNCELLRAIELGVPHLRRGEFLAKFAAGYRRCVAVTGSHGKSSVTSLLAVIFRRCGSDPGFMIGAAVAGFPSCAPGDGDIFITEADESDGTHTCLRNALAVIPNVEDDHAWSVGGAAALDANFRTVAARSERILYYASPKCDELFHDHPRAERLPAPPQRFAGYSGFQAANAYLAVRAATLLGCDPDAAERAAADAPQVARRMTLRAETPDVVLIEDYAHHPTEVRAALTLLKDRYPGRHLRVVFQPHRYARLERYFAEFAEILAAADSRFILPVFSAWCERGPVDGAKLAAACGGAYADGSWRECAERVVSGLPRPAVIAVLGAGDCEEILPYLETSITGGSK